MKLRDPKIVEHFKLELGNHFQLLEEDDPEGEELDDINTKYKIRDETSENILYYKEAKQKDLITEKTWNNISERWNLKAKINTSRTGGRTVQIRNIKARIKKLQR
jgi:hypothetical protein